MTRRQFLRTGAAATACPTVAATTSGCSGTHRQEDQARWLRRPLVASTLSTEQFQEIVRCATLAANGHNTQPWRFHLEPDRITISPDFSRRTPAVDPDDHHLWVSLGCATENLVHAARALGKYADVEQTLQDIRISFTNSPPERSSLVDAIFQRQCTRADYDGRQMPSDVLHALEEAGAVNGVGLRLVTGRAQMETVLEYVTAGNSAQMRDPAFVAELKHWIRFDDAEAAESGDGLFTRASGNPTSPSWLGSRMFSLYLYREIGKRQVRQTDPLIRRRRHLGWRTCRPGELVWSRASV